MVSIRYFSGDAALSCWKVIPAAPATFTNVTGFIADDSDQAFRVATVRPAAPSLRRKSRLEKREIVLTGSAYRQQLARPEV